MKSFSSEKAGETASTWRWARLCFALVAGLQVVVLAAWIAGRWEFLRLGEGWVPTAPLTAVALLGLALAAWLWQSYPTRSLARWLGTAVAIGVLLVILLFTVGILGGNRVMSSESAGPPGIPVGRMSPLTAIALLLATAGLLLRIHSRWRNTRLRQTAAMLVFVLFFASGGIISSYMLQMPLFYGSPMIPMALLTAICLGMLSLGLLLLMGRDVWPASLVSASVVSPEEAAARKWWELPLLVVFLSAGIVGLVSVWLRHERTEAHDLAVASISTIADMKANQIAEWYRERKADAATIQRAPVSESVERYLNDPAAEGAAEPIRSWLEALHRAYGYSLVQLIDGEGRLRLSAPPAEAPVDRRDVEDSREALEKTDVVIQDLHRHRPGGTTHLTMIVPLATGRSGATLLLDLEAEHFLFPLVQSWPVRSTTSETILARRTENGVEFLSALRHRPDPSSNLMLPAREFLHLIGSPDAAGSGGVIEADDYRGTSVVAAVRDVPGTPWFIVAKIDRAEVYAPFRREVTRTAVFLLVLLLAAVAGVSLLWYRRDLASAERAIRAGDELRVAHERLRRMIDANIVGVVIADPHGRVLEANDYYLNMLGVSREAFERGELDWRAVTPPEWQAADERALQQLRDTGTCAAYEKEYVRRDGTRVPVLLVDALLGGPDTRIVAFALDLTERKEASDALRYREQLLSQMGRIAKIGGWEFDPATGRGTWTPEVARIHDVDPDVETSVKIGLEFYEGDSRAKIEQALKDAVELGREYDLELELTSAKGIRKWIHTIGHPTVENGQVVRMTGSMQDITERKRAEAVLSKQMEELRRWHDATLHRESRVLELKREVNQILASAGLPPRYPSAETKETGAGSESASQ